MHKLRFLAYSLIFIANCTPIFAQDDLPYKLTEPTKEGPAWLDQWPSATPLPTSSPDPELQWYAQQLEVFPQQKNLILYYARVLYQKGQHQQAMDHLAPLLSQAATAREIQAQVAQWRLEQGQYTEIIQQLAPFVQNYLVDPELYYLLGLAYESQAQTEQAHQAFFKVLLLKPDHLLKDHLSDLSVYQTEIKAIQSKNLLATLLKQTNPQSKLSLLKELIQQQPQLKQAYHELALLLESQGKFAAAASWREQLMQLDSCYLNNQTLYARYLFWAGYLEPARSYLQQQMACAPDPGAADWLGQVISKQGQLDSAIQHYQKSLKQWPQQPRLLIGLANAYLLAQNYSESAKVLTQLKHFDHSAWYVRSQLLLANAQPLSAIQDLQKALAASKRVEYQQALLLAYIQAGMATEAQQALQAYRQFPGVLAIDVLNYEKTIQALPRRGKFDVNKVRN